MKLKKIASLMLAGIMAVSMLTACGNTVSEKPEDPTEEPDVVVSAATDMLYSELSGSAKARVTAVANDKLDTVLAEAADKYWDYNSPAGFDHVFKVDRWRISGAVQSGMGANYNSIMDFDRKATSDKSATEVFVVDASTSDAYVMELLAERIDKFVDRLPEISGGHDNHGAWNDYVYSYDISASIAEKTVTFAGVETGIKYVALYMVQNVAENA